MIVGGWCEVGCSGGRVAREVGRALESERVGFNSAADARLLRDSEHPASLPRPQSPHL